MSRPWMKFYPADWRSDPKLRMCSIGARGLWMEMLCLMHEADPYGHLVSNSAPISAKNLAKLCGISVSSCMKYLLELASAGVYSIDDKKRIYSRRMLKDLEKSERDRENGRFGGNPKLKAAVNMGVNPPDKAQKPEARSQIPENNSEAVASGADAPPDPTEPERELFKRGKEVLGKSAGGQITKLLRVAGNVALARSKIELAATKQDPHEFIAKVISHAGAGPPAKPLTQHQIERQNTRTILDELDQYAGGGSGGQADFGLLRHDPGSGSASVHGGVRRTLIDLPVSRDREGG